MVASSQTASLFGEINEITSECHRALETLRLRSASGGSGACFKKADLKDFRRLINAHGRNLMRVALVPAELQQKKQAVARKVIWDALAAHTCAVIRAAVKRDAHLSPDQIRAGALNGKKWLVLKEPITVWWRPKYSGGYRLMTKDGVFRTAQRFVLRDMLQVLGIDNDLDYSRSGS
jgi:hypothetical protein